MKEDINEIKIMLANIETDIRHHIKRTDLLEEEVRAWRRDMEPVQKHITVVNGLGKLLLILAAVASAVAAMFASFKF